MGAASVHSSRLKLAYFITSQVWYWFDTPPSLTGCTARCWPPLAAAHPVRFESAAPASTLAASRLNARRKGGGDPSGQLEFSMWVSQESARRRPAARGLLRSSLPHVARSGQKARSRHAAGLRRAPSPCRARRATRFRTPPGSAVQPRLQAPRPGG